MSSKEATSVSSILLEIYAYKRGIYTLMYFKKMLGSV